MSEVDEILANYERIRLKTWGERKQKLVLLPPPPPPKPPPPPRVRAHKPRGVAKLRRALVSGDQETVKRELLERCSRKHGFHSYQRVAAALKRLQKQGLIERLGPGNLPFHLTEHGRNVLHLMKGEKP